MRNIWKWILFGLAFFVLAFVVALPLFGGFAMMPMRWLGAGGVPRGMMAGSGMLGAGMFGWIGLALRCIVPLAAVAGLIALVVVLVRKPAAPAAVPPLLPSSRPCRAPTAGKPCRKAGRRAPSAERNSNLGFYWSPAAPPLGGAAVRR